MGYTRTPSVDDICRRILADGAPEAKAWSADHPEAGEGVYPFQTRSYFEAGAEGCWLDGGQAADGGPFRIEAIVVRLSDDLATRRKIYKLLCEHLCQQVEACENSSAVLEDPKHYFGEEYCLIRYDWPDHDDLDPDIDTP